MSKYIRTKNGLELMNESHIEIEKTYREKRYNEYGSISEQLEFITEKGLEAWQKKVTEIKLKYPKYETI